MKLTDHIAYRFLTDPKLTDEIIDLMLGRKMTETKLGTLEDKEAVVQEFARLYTFLRPDGNTKNYYITQTVTEKLKWLDSKKALTIEGWKVFATLPDFKDTYIFSEKNVAIRVEKTAGFLYFFHLSFTPSHNKDKNSIEKKIGYGEMYSILFWADIEANRLCTHFESQDVKEVVPEMYSLLCFLKLTENDEITVPAGHRHGTRKSGKLVNLLPCQLIVVTSRWNTTVHRDEGFPVTGHVRLQPYGKGMASYKLIFIEPYMKNGYHREAGNKIVKP